MFSSSFCVVLKQLEPSPRQAEKKGTEKSAGRPEGGITKKCACQGKGEFRACFLQLVVRSRFADWIFRMSSSFCVVLGGPEILDGKNGVPVEEKAPSKTKICETLLP